jgi:hypothetical protein
VIKNKTVMVRHSQADTINRESTFAYDYLSRVPTYVTAPAGTVGVTLPMDRKAVMQDSCLVRGLCGDNDGFYVRETEKTLPALVFDKEGYPQEPDLYAQWVVQVPQSDRVSASGADLRELDTSAFQMFPRYDQQSMSGYQGLMRQTEFMVSDSGLGQREARERERIRVQEQIDECGGRKTSYAHFQQWDQ